MKFIAFFLTVVVCFVLPGCSLVKEGITGEGTEEVVTPVETTPEVEPAAFPVIGDWLGIYNDSEYLELKFTADGKCELQTAVYPSDVFGARYYGEYLWGGDDGREITLDLYKGQSKEVDYGYGFIMDEWSDGGRESATTALMMTFRVYGGEVKSFAVKAVGAGIDTEGYTIVQPGAFIVLLAEAMSGNGNPSPYLFGTMPLDPTEDKSGNSILPDTFAETAERCFTIEDLNVRCGPGTGYKTYGTVPTGTPVDVIASAEGKDDWSFVLLSDGGGWVNKDYLSVTKPEVKPVPEEDTMAPAGDEAND
jgi:hypothetical protein